MFKDGDIVKIKEEFCDSQKEQNSMFIVTNVNDITKNCCISLIDKENKYSFGLSNNVKEDMIYLVKGRDYITEQDIPHIIDVNINKNILTFTYDNGIKKVIYLDSLKYDNTVDSLVEILTIFEDFMYIEDETDKIYTDYDAFMKQNKLTKDIAQNKTDGAKFARRQGYTSECLGKVVKINTNTNIVYIGTDNCFKGYPFRKVVDTIYATGLFNNGVLYYLSNPSTLKPLFKIEKQPYLKVYNELHKYLIRLNKKS